MPEKITQSAGGLLQVPDEPIIPYIEGDGTGVDIWPAAELVLDAAADQARQDGSPGRKSSRARRRSRETGNWLPDETVAAFRDHLVGIKGPLTTPDRRRHPLAQRGAAPDPRPLRLPAAGALVPGRALAGEAPREGRHGDLPREHRGRLRRHRVRGGDPRGARSCIAFLQDELRLGDPRPTPGIGIKPVSKTGSERLVRAAIEYAIEHDRKSVTLVHKGNIKKFTEGAFRNWGYELVARRVRRRRRGGWDDCGGNPGDKILIKDAIADITLQQVLTRPEEFDVIATMNLNGDYLSDALAAQVGGIGIAPGGNINYVTGHAVFEATHGTAPKYAGQDKVNPGSVMLSGEMMFEHLGWTEAADRHRARAGGDDRRQDRHLRLRPPDGGRHRGQVLASSPRRHRRPPLRRTVRERPHRAPP